MRSSVSENSITYLLRWRSINTTTDSNDLALVIPDFYICDADPSANFNSPCNRSKATAFCWSQIINPKIHRWHIPPGF
jgi:hypothetical protein